jgi:hypothetical protein
LQGKLLQQAWEWLEQAVDGLRRGAWQQFVLSGLLARAALFRHRHDFARARQDLQEVFDIAEPSRMRLHLTDYHLEMAWLMLAEQEEGDRPRQHHIEAAAKLITATGYHRRDPELAELQQQLASLEGITP